MSKGFAVESLTKQRREVVVNEALIRDCISFKPTFTTEEDRIRVVGNQEKLLRSEKVKSEAAHIELQNVTMLTMSFRKIGSIENLYGLRMLSKLLLDNNHISRIENLGHLVHLEWLDLSFNCITVVEGLEQLVNLNCLSLYANQLTEVGGLDTLTELNTLSIGKNKIENLDDTVHYLHQLRKLRVLTLDGCPVVSSPHYRSRVLAFVPGLRFLDGRRIVAEEAAKAREDQRENLLTVDAEDDTAEAAGRTKAEEEAAAAAHVYYNCPNDATLYDELLHLKADGRDMAEILHNEAVFSVSKEPLDRYQAEFNEQLKQLTEAMKTIRERRDQDDKAYHEAVSHVMQQHAAKSKELIKQYESQQKRYVPKGIGSLSFAQPLSSEVIDILRQLLEQLKVDLFEVETVKYDVLEVLHNSTVAKWKSDAVEVVLQSSFEVLLKLEADFHIALRQIFDTVFELRQKRDAAPTGYYYEAQNEILLAFLENKEEYQRATSEWYEVRRKRLEELEMMHLKAEETLVGTRTQSIIDVEQARHRNRVKEVCEYINQMMDTIEGYGN